MNSEIQNLTNRYHELVRYENDNKADFSHEKKEIWQIRYKLFINEIKRLKAELWEREQTIKQNTAKIPKNQTRLEI